MAVPFDSTQATIAAQHNLVSYLPRTSMPQSFSFFFALFLSLQRCDRFPGSNQNWRSAVPRIGLPKSGLSPKAASMKLCFPASFKSFCGLKKLGLAVQIFLLPSSQVGSEYTPQAYFDHKITQLFDDEYRKPPMTPAGPERPQKNWTAATATSLGSRPEL